MPRSRDLLGSFFFQRGDRNTVQFRTQRTRDTHQVRGGRDVAQERQFAPSQRRRRSRDQYGYDDSRGAAAGEEIHEGEGAGHIELKFSIAGI